MNINDPKFFNDYYHKRNQTWQWLNSDSVEDFQKNLKNNYDLLKSNGWIDKTVTYKLNNYGFRCDNFSHEENIVFLGCSITMGIGLNYEDLYVTKVSQSLGLKCNNLGLAASSNDTAFRLALIYLKELKPKIVVLHNQFSGRMEVLDTTHARFLLPSYNPEAHPDLYKVWLGTEENLYLNKTKNVLAIESLAKSIGAKFVHTTDADRAKNPPKTYARDLLHPGYTYHDALAKSVLSYIS
jgi:hypothetical protein